jgi:hypothetical protein
LHEAECEHDLVISDFRNSGGGPEHSTVSSGIRLWQRGACWTKLFVGTTRYPGVYDYDAGQRDCGVCASHRGINCCHSSSARVRNAPRRNHHAPGPEHLAFAANHRFATWLTLGTNTEPCTQRCRHNGIAEQHVFTVCTIEQWRGSSSSRNRTAELDE